LGEEYKSFSSLLCNLLHSPITSSHKGTNNRKYEAVKKYRKKTVSGDRGGAGNKKNQNNQSVIDKNGVDMGKDICHSYSGVDANSSLQ